MRLFYLLNSHIAPPPNNAVGLVTIIFLERYPILFRIGQISKNCENLTVFFFYFFLRKELNLMYYLLIKSKFLYNRVIQASGLNGPIPHQIAFLENLSDLSVWLYKSVAIYCFIGNCILFYFNFLLLFKFRYLGELVT